MTQLRKLIKIWTIEKSSIFANPNDKDDVANKKYVDEKIETIDILSKYVGRSLFVETFIKKATCWYHTDPNSNNDVYHQNKFVSLLSINQDWTTMQHKTNKFTPTEDIFFKKEWKTLFLFHWRQSLWSPFPIFLFSSAWSFCFCACCFESK